MTIAEIYSALAKAVERYDAAVLDSTELRDAAMDAVINMGKILGGQ